MVVPSLSLGLRAAAQARPDERVEDRRGQHLGKPQGVEAQGVERVDERPSSPGRRAFAPRPTPIRTFTPLSRRSLSPPDATACLLGGRRRRAGCRRRPAVTSGRCPSDQVLQRGIGRLFGPVWRAGSRGVERGQPAAPNSTTPARAGGAIIDDSHVAVAGGAGFVSALGDSGRLWRSVTARVGWRPRADLVWPTVGRPGFLGRDGRKDQIGELRCGAADPEPGEGEAGKQPEVGEAGRHGECDVHRPDRFGLMAGPHDRDGSRAFWRGSPPNWAPAMIGSARRRAATARCGRHRRTHRPTAPRWWSNGPKLNASPVSTRCRAGNWVWKSRRMVGMATPGTGCRARCSPGRRRLPRG